VVPGRLADGIGGGAGRVPLPGGHAGDDTAHDGTEAGDVLVALAITEAGATGLPLAAVTIAACAVAIDAVVAAGARTAAAASAAICRMTIHVIARVSTAVVGARPGVFGPPPTTDHRTGRAGVDTGHRAAELGPAAVAAPASRRTAARRVDNRRIGVSRSENVGGRGRHQRR